MSGLVGFFSSFISPGSIQQVTQPTEEEGEGVRYQASLADLTFASPSSEDVPPRRLFQARNGDTALTQGTARYEDWRRLCQQNLTSFLMKRFLESEGPQDAGDDKENDNAAEVSMDETQPTESQTEPESQADFLGGKHMQEKTSAKLPPLPKIPLIESTEHIATTVSAMDLFTKSLTLNLCSIEKVFPLRQTKRMEILHNLSASPASSTPHSPLDIFVFGNFQPDGPLFPVYKYVLSMEVMQLEHYNAATVREAASAALPEGKLYRRLSIYFYNHYANVVDRFLQKYGSKPKLYIAFDKIPGCCIFPYRVDKAGWFDQYISPYVVCIGGKSKITLFRETDDEEGKLYFESDDLKISILAISDDEGQPLAEEVVIDKDAAAVETMHESNGNVQKALDLWRESHQRAQQFMTIEQSVATEAAIMHHQEQVPADSAETGGRVLEQIIADQEDVQPLVEKEEAERGQKRPIRFEEKVSSGQERLHKRAKAGVPQGYHELVNLVDIFTAHRNTPKDAITLRSQPIVNVIGIVLGFSLPARTKTDNWMITLNIVDRSLSKQESGGETNDSRFVINLNIFRKMIEELPTVKKAGDLVILKGAIIQEYRGEMQLLGRTSTSIEILSRDNENKFGPELIGEGRQNGVEPRFLNELWHWGQQRLATKSTIKDAERFDLSEVDALDGAGDVTVMISGVHETADPEHRRLPFGFLRVWDGTGVPISDRLPDDSRAASAMIADGDPPKEALISLHSTILYLNDQYDSNFNDIVSVCGRVVNVAIWEQPHWTFVKENLHIGDFIRIRNIKKGQLDNGIVCLMALAKTWIYPLPKSAVEVRHLLKVHQARIERGDSYNNSSGLLPLQGAPPLEASLTAADMEPLELGPTVREVSRRAAHLSTIDQCLRTCGLFYSRFSISGVSGSHTGDLVSINNKGRPAFDFVAKIADSTAEADVLFHGKIGNQLLGVSASEAQQMDNKEGAKLLFDICRAGCWWRANLESREFAGEIFIIVKSIERET